MSLAAFVCDSLQNLYVVDVYLNKQPSLGSTPKEGFIHSCGIPAASRKDFAAEWAAACTCLSELAI